MSSLYQAPLIPGMGSNIGSPMSSNYAPTRNPFFAVSNQFLPRNLHDVVRWARYITTQSPVTTEVIRKLATYPITDFIVDTESAATKSVYEDLFKLLKLKSALHSIGFEYFTVGNVFISVYFPIMRTLKCPACSAAYSAKKAEFLKVESYEYKGKCPTCGTQGTFTRTDSKDMTKSRINLVSWDPLNIQVNHNPITGESEYYYKIPNEVKRRVKMGDRLFIDSIPWALVEAIKNNMDFKFDNDKIYHLKNVSAGHIVEGIAVPPLISQFGLVFYQATLRKANESIASDFMAPLRVIFPQAQTGNSDPVVAMSMKNFVNHMQNAMVKHKTDNNHVLIAPMPIGYEAISGEGKTLLVAQELLQSEESLLLSMGVSRELLSGQTNWTSSTVGLRMLANTLQCYVDQIEGLIEWVMTSIAKFLSIEPVGVSLAPFRLTDDDALRQILLQLAQNNLAAPSDLFESMGLDYTEVLRKLRSDTVKKAVNDARTQLEVDKAVFLETKKLDEKDGEDSEYKQALAKAQQLAEQLVNVDESSKRQVMNQLRVEDYAMYLMVGKLLEEYNTANRAKLDAQLATQAAAGKPGEGGPGGSNGAEEGPPGAGGDGGSVADGPPSNGAPTETRPGSFGPQA